VRVLIISMYVPIYNRFYTRRANKVVFVNLFAAAEPFISVKITPGTPWHAMIREFNSVGKVKFSGCLGIDVPSKVERQKTCVSLGKTLKS